MNKPAPSRYVAGVSWPRSGHHLLQRMVQSYFEGLRYCDFYGPATDCCKQVPCARPNVHFSKSHDFDSEVRPQAGVPYLIQYRSLSPSLVSDWELFVRDDHADDYETFRDFAYRKATLWAGFVMKWVDPVKTDWDRCILYYEDLVAHPEREMEKAVRFFAPDKEPNRALIAHVCANVSAQKVTKDSEAWEQNAGVKDRSNVQAFRHYDAKMFDDVEALARNLRAAILRPLEEVA